MTQEVLCDKCKRTMQVKDEVTQDSKLELVCKDCISDSWDDGHEQSVLDEADREAEELTSWQESEMEDIAGVNDFN